MSFKLDHVIISVQDLEAAIERYKQLGFNAFYGGKHGDGLTHNGLIVFADGSYLELIALVNPAEFEKAAFKQLIREEEGYTGYALLSDNIDSDIQAMQQQGIQTNAIRAGSRQRGDGALLKWRMAKVGTIMAPFIIQDETARKLRVPDDAATTTHPNGVQGITDVTILAQDFGTRVAHYSALLGTMAQMSGDVAIFVIDGTTLTIRPPQDDIEQHYAVHFGAVPFQLTLTTSTTPTSITADAAHGARFNITAAP